MKLFKTKYEKESFLKSFFLFFLSIEFLVSVILFFHYKELAHSFKDSIFLEMKNYSYTFEGKDFKLELVEKEKNKNFYQLYEDKNSLYIYVPIPFAEKEVFKIYYPKDLYYKYLLEYKLEVAVEFLISSIISALISAVFAYISINPLRKAITLIEEVTKDIIHDINTPVSGILINLKLLKMKHKESKEIDRIELSVKQLSSLYENLRTLIEGFKIHKEDINLKEIIEEEVKVYESIYPDIKVEKNLKDVYKKLDKTAFKRVVSNLLGNAFKHNIPKNGWVKIVLNESELIIENSSKPVKKPEKVFERYYREGQRGLGLGLSIVKKLCDEMECQVKFTAQKNSVKVKIIFPV
jgi:two-component system OmpR family sensor kinase